MKNIEQLQQTLNAHQRPEQDTCRYSNPRATVDSMRATRSSEDQQVSGEATDIDRSLVLDMESKCSNSLKRRIDFQRIAWIE
jgi:hypothetical protein